MLNDLLKYSIDRIDSIYFFYKSELKDIKKKSLKGMMENRLAYQVKMYTKILALDSKEIIESDDFKELENELKKYIEVKKIERKGLVRSVEYTILDSSKKELQEPYYSNGVTNYEKYAEMPFIHGTSVLIMLITRFEEFFSNLLSEVFIMFPGKYLDNETVKYSEICSSDPEIIKRRIVQRQVDIVMRKSFADWLELLKSHKLSFDCCEKEIETLNEIYARRNIMVHNSGIVNSQYLSMVKESPYKEGKRLEADKEYIKNAYQCIKIIIFNVLIEACRFVKEDKEDYLEEIFAVGFQELSRENYVVSNNVFSKLLNNPNFSQEYKLMSKINYWISVKEIEGLENIKNDIYNFDVSALSDNFKLARDLLLENYGIASVHLCKMIETKQIDKSSIEEWPLFRRYIKTSHYEALKEAYKEFFGVSYITIQPSNDETSVNISTEEEIGELI